MSIDRRVELLRRLAESTDFEGEREAALRKAAELEARGKVAKPATEHKAPRTIFDPVGDGDPLEVDLDDDSDPIWERVPFTSPWANFGYGGTVNGYTYRPRADVGTPPRNGKSAYDATIDEMIRRNREEIARIFGIDVADLADIEARSRRAQGQ